MGLGITGHASLRVPSDGMSQKRINCSRLLMRRGLYRSWKKLQEVRIAEIFLNVSFLSITLRFWAEISRFGSMPEKQSFSLVFERRILCCYLRGPFGEMKTNRELWCSLVVNDYRKILQKDFVEIPVAQFFSFA